MKRAWSSLMVARQAAAHFVERNFDRIATPLKVFLAVDRDVVAERLEWLARKGVIDALRLLQAHDVGLALGKPCRPTFSSRCLIELRSRWRCAWAIDHIRLSA